MQNSLVPVCKAVASDLAGWVLAQPLIHRPNLHMHMLVIHMEL